MTKTTLKRALGALVATAAVAAAAAAPAQAGVLTTTATGCTDGTAARVFLPWLDVANYVAAPGGNAESARGWTLRGGAQITAGNEPWRVGGAADAHSLALPAGAQATTRAMCVGLENPTVRFFAKRTSGSLLSTLLVEVLFEDASGSTRSLPIGTVLSTGSWQPTLPFPVLANLLPLLPGAKTAVAFRFTPVGRAAWQIDDVYVDPWRAR
jgi:hypothetical protein